VPQPTDPPQTQTQPSDPEHTDPKHTQTQPSDPEHTDPKHTQPQPSDPEHTDPKHTQPQPSDPEHTDPEHTQTQPSDRQHTEADSPNVLFLCVHNAGRSQMALGWFEHLARGRATAYSGGSEPADQVNPAAVQAMAEVGIDIAGARPRRWTEELVRTADVVVTMGCGDTCPVLPGIRYEDWALDDPAGQGVDAVRPIRDEIERRVRTLLTSLGIEP
jgi:arsenate reductase (thioredoxin)